MKNSLFVLFSWVLFSIPILVFGHGSNYLEFNPDYFKTKSLNVSTAGTIYEILLPSNEFFGGADFWFDNAGSSGLATFELHDNNNNLIATRSVTVPHINPVAGGQRVHVDWNFQVPVIGSNKYKIKISSSLPQLQIYYSDRVKFLGHNEPHISDYLNGVAEINGEEKEFSFKYALYEVNESSAPIISNVSWTVIPQDQMRMDFNSNEPIDFKIEYGQSGQGYGQTVDFSGQYQFCSQGVSACSSTISVSPDIIYQYILTVKDSWGNQSQTTGTFTSGQSQSPSLTPTPADPPPEVSNLRAVNTTANSVEIAWTTNEVANSYLVISFSSDYITIAAASDPTFELEHLLASEPVLGAGITYLATIRTIDLGGSETKASLSFTTLAASPTPTPTPTPTPSPTGSVPPVPSPLTSQPPQPSIGTSPSASSTPQPSIIVSSSPSGDGTNTGSVQWGAPAKGEPNKGYRIDVFDKSGKLVQTVFAPKDSHNAEIPGLPKGNYNVIVYADNNGVFEKVAKPVSLNTDASFAKRLLALWPYLIIAVALLGVFAWLHFRKSSQTVKQVVS